MTSKPTPSDLFSLYEEMELEIIEFCRKQRRTSTVFCRKYGDVITVSFAKEHGCFRPKRVYENSEGKMIYIYCPNIIVTKGMQEFYKIYSDRIYETGNAIYGVKVHTQKRPELEKTEDPMENLEKIKDAGRRILKEGLFNGSD